MRAILSLAALGSVAGLILWFASGTDGSTGRLADRNPQHGRVGHAEASDLETPDGPNTADRQPRLARNNAHTGVASTSERSLDGPVSRAEATGDSVATELAESPPKAKVHFRIASADSSSADDAIASLAVLRMDAAAEETTRFDWTGPKLAVDLTPGNYSAAFVESSGLLAPVTTFDVTGEAQTVELQAPGHATLTFAVVDDATGEPIPGARARASRSDAIGFPSSLTSTHEPVADGAGVLRFETLSYGAWQVTVGAAGYADEVAPLDLPGRWASTLAKGALLDLGDFALVAIRPFQVELENYRDWGEPTGFRIAHTAEGEQVPFDAQGRATLPLGWFGEPLHLKLWYPTGQVAVLYLDGGMPATGTPFEIDVSKRRGIEVDLQIDEAIEPHLTIDRHPIRVTCVTPRGDSFMAALHVDGGGVYTIPAIPGRHATVGFATEIDGEYPDLVTENVHLAEEGLTACTLSVTGLPRRVRVVDSSGAPVVGSYVEVREVTDRTSWLTGARTNANGEFDVPHISSGRFALRACDLDAWTLVVDRKVFLDPGGGVAEVVIDYGEPTQVCVLVDGQPREGIKVELSGPLSEAPFRTHTSSAEGTIRTWRIDRASTATARVADPRFWPADHSIALDAGQNTVALFSTATIVLNEAVDLDRVANTDLGATLRDWVDGSLVRTVNDGGERRVRVPVGAYSLRPPAGDPVRFDLGIGQTVVVRPGSVE